MFELAKPAQNYERSYKRHDSLIEVIRDNVDVVFEFAKPAQIS